jgi:hypothetical protein
MQRTGNAPSRPDGLAMSRTGDDEMDDRPVASHEARKDQIPMCLTCGCMDAHLEMGEHNIRYEDIKAAADENGRTVAETLAIMEKTEAKDRQSHPQEWGAEVGATK